jgi:hypothetical protein
LNVSHRARALTLAVLLAGCGGASAPQIECASAPILDGSPATVYPEGVILLLSQEGAPAGECSGALVAPRVVLTAGHCVASYTAWSLRAPFADQSAKSSAGETFDWKADGTDHVKADQHDVGLVYLDTPIDLPTYPALAGAAVTDGTDIVNIGRVHEGYVSASLYISPPLGVSSGAKAGFPFDYITSQVIEGGDSGGPVELLGVTPHLIVGVNSGVSGGAEFLARVDLLTSWIQDRIAAHGGGGAPESPAAIPATPHDTPRCIVNP